jgi:hypothetical protein
MIRRLLTAARNRASAHDGAVALLTLVFMVGAGLVMIVFLWSIAYATSVYSYQLQANQAAAYAAVQSVITGSGEGEEAGGQLVFDCGPSYDPATGWCTAGKTFTAADSALRNALPATVVNGRRAGRFNLVYDPTGGGNVFTLRTTEGAVVPDRGIYAWSIPYDPAEARRVDGNCDNQPDPGINPAPQGGPPYCWTFSPFGPNARADDEHHYTSGVAIYLASTISLPGCVASWCPTWQIHTGASATQDQVPQQVYVR